MTRFAHSPGSPYKAIIDGIWPQLGGDDPRQYDWDVALREATTHTMAHRPSRDMPLEFLTPGQPDPLRGPDVRPLLRVKCVARRHNHLRPPTLAEVWQTSVGLLFVADLPGRLRDPGEVATGPFAPPAAVRNVHKRDRQPHVLETPAIDWDHVRITRVRLLLRAARLAARRAALARPSGCVGAPAPGELGSVGHLHGDRGVPAQPVR